MAQAFCILGMHRSGTSLVAQLLAHLGVDFGPREELLEATADNPKGYWEIERIVHANDWILQTLGRRWDTAFPLPRGWHSSPELRRHRAHVRTVLEELFAGQQRFGWKDPRCCLTSPLWRDALENAGTRVHSILVLRNPLDVARSLAKRNAFDISNALGLWYHYTLQSLVDSADTARVTVRYQDLLDRPHHEVARLADALSLDSSLVEPTVDETVDPELCHSRSGTDDLAGEAPELVHGLYARIVATVKGELSWRELDREADERLRALERYAAVLHHDREREVRESSRIEQLESQLRILSAREAGAERMEEELEGIYASTWWQMANRYWRLRRRLVEVTSGWLGGSHRIRLPSSASRDPFARITSPWDARATLEGCSDPCFCNLCLWSGPAFKGGAHSEFARCPQCGSIARDRFLFFCFITRTPPGHYRVLETSPRLGEAYRKAMRRWFEYRASDFDLRAHRADLHLDLQDIHLEPASVDVLLTPHVLEHAPDTDKALDNIHRLLAPGGRMYLQVPVLQGYTSRPHELEVHRDDTPVEWRFGPDLTPRLIQHGFDAQLLCPWDLHHRVERGDKSWDAATSSEYDVEALLAGLGPVDLLPVVGHDTCQKLGFEPSYMFLTWEATRQDPSSPTP